uniref:Uncharacterized protein n=1 Tax=Myoviridae sp. ctn8H20 TaxID=2825169 RepID=A0A8S5QGP8_9CAUD|nr:MAG TPA: hypothetical protein [Myoviridae sp. ctn8H20]
MLNPAKNRPNNCTGSTEISIRTQINNLILNIKDLI